MLVLVARGNVIVGDYLDNQPGKFQDHVLPLIDGSGGYSSTSPYVVTQADTAIGYGRSPSSLCGGAAPCFDGKYNSFDGGHKMDGTPRKFYESGLSNAAWRAYAVDKANDPMYQGTAGSVCSIHAVIDTDHLMAGYIDAEWVLTNGGMVSRDDGLAFMATLLLSHDRRLVANNVADLGLPGNFARPKPIQWFECPPAGCP